MSMPRTPHPEEEYFGKIDILKLRKAAEAKRNKIAKEERERLKKLHWRRCAECGMELSTIPFKGKTIYKCFNCNSTFLTAGELEKICGEESHILDALLSLFRF